MTDADVDGAHIRTLLLTFFYRQMPDWSSVATSTSRSRRSTRSSIGKDEQYLKDGTELDAYLLRVALKDAQLDTGIEGSAVLQGETLETLARQYVLANNVVERLSNVDGRRGAARDGQRPARSTSTRSKPPSLGPGAEGRAARRRSDRRVRRPHRQAHPAHQPHAPRQREEQRDHRRLRARRRLRGAEHRRPHLQGPGQRSRPPSSAARARSQKEAKVGDFRAAMAWLMPAGRNSVARQRYKGLGEMNPAQLWETTMDPTVRRLLRVQIDDAIEADRVFTMLMGDEVEPRREFIETNALRAANIDV
jgi:DNA gyrase subunit B